MRTPLTFALAVATFTLLACGEASSGNPQVDQVVDQLAEMARADGDEVSEEEIACVKKMLGGLSDDDAAALMEWLETGDHDAEPDVSDDAKEIFENSGRCAGVE